MKDKIILCKYLKKVFETPSIEGSEWFGYYNYDTLNSDQTKLLANRVKEDGAAPQKGQIIELGYYEIATGSWHKIGESDSWNWQQGAMMQWLPDDSIIYNTSENNHIVAKIYDTKSKKTCTIDWAIYGITPDGKKSIALDLERSYWCRAYHYQSVANPEVDGAVVETDGIFEIDLANNSRKRIISIQEIISIEKGPNFDSKKHWVEHIMINPSGTMFCFLHRFASPENVYDYKTRLFIANIDGTNLRVVHEWDEIDMTHFGWRDDNHFGIYTYSRLRFENKGLKKLLSFHSLNPLEYIKALLAIISLKLPYKIGALLTGRHTCYYLYEIKDDSINKMDIVENNYMKVDGHPSFAKDGRYMITDSYPWSDGKQRLLVYDTINRKTLVLGEFFAYYKGNPASCDLHPKLSRDEGMLVVDTAYDNKHHMMVFKLNWDSIINDSK